MDCIQFEIDQERWQGNKPGGQLRVLASVHNGIPALSLLCVLYSISIPYGAWSTGFAVGMKTKGGIYRLLQEQVTDANYGKCGWKRRRN